MGRRIRWKKLKAIASEIAGRPFGLHGSTDVPPEAKALVRFTRSHGSADVMLNLNYLKDEDSVIQALAHELAHIVLGSNTHDQDHAQKTVELEKEIRRRMEEEPAA